MVVDDPDLPCFGRLPTENDPPLPVDPDIIKARKIPFQRLEPVSRRRSEIFERAGGVEHIEPL